MNIKDSFETITAPFSPKVVGEVNDVYVKIAIIDGDKVPWHNHKDEDELFYVIEGSLVFEEEGKESFTMGEGDIYTVKRGVNHRVFSTKPCKIMLIENKTLAHTGDVESEITKSIDEQLG